MKKILLATTMLAASAGFASADITLTGDARMGVVYNADGFENYDFTSRARVKFVLSGESDNGLTFGAKFRAGEGGSNLNLEDASGDEPGDPGFDSTDGLFGSFSGAGNGGKGEVFISGAFGTLSMGDTDSAAESAVGDVDCISLSLCDTEEISKEDNAYASGGDPAALYSYTAGGFTGYLSAKDGQAYEILTDADGNNYLGEVAHDSYGVGAKYATDAYSVALAYQGGDDARDILSFGAGATFQGVSLKAVVAQFDETSSNANDDYVEYSISAAYTWDAIGVAAFYNDNDQKGSEEAYGIGASYDLGGGAAVKGGVIEDGDTMFDIGVSMEF